MIGGNLDATFQVKLVTENDLGEHINTWADFITVSGWLDLTSGNSTYSHKTKTEESTHVLLTDYNKTVRGLFINKCRCVIEDRIYQVTFIDDPMEIHDHLEIFLKLVGVASE
jgi:SPP1 family predicted phage head-tail adaptor